MWVLQQYNPTPLSDHLANGRPWDLERKFAPEALVVVSADAVYKLDYRDVVAGHLDSDSDVTMVTTRVDETLVLTSARAARKRMCYAMARPLEPGSSTRTGTRPSR